MCVFLNLNTGGQTFTAERKNVLLINNELFPPSLRYYKITDPASWIDIDRDSGELRVANTIDRESHYVHDGIYNITVKAVDASKLLVNAAHFLVIDFYSMSHGPNCFYNTTKMTSLLVPYQFNLKSCQTSCLLLVLLHQPKVIRNTRSTLSICPNKRHILRTPVTRCDGTSSTMTPSSLM